MPTKQQVGAIDDMSAGKHGTPLIFQEEVCLPKRKFVHLVHVDSLLGSCDPQTYCRLRRSLLACPIVFCSFCGIFGWQCIGLKLKAFLHSHSCRPCMNLRSWYHRFCTYLLLSKNSNGCGRFRRWSNHFMCYVHGISRTRVCSG